MTTWYCPLGECWKPYMGVKGCPNTNFKYNTLCSFCKYLLGGFINLSKKTTTVVNRYHKEPFDVFIGRGSKWGNPFTHLDSTIAQYKVDTREEAIDNHQSWIFTQRDLLANLKEIKGKVLGCYCKPKDCHGDILAKLADTTHWKDGKIILECSTLGDIRFSAFGAEVEMFGVKATIEEHYQLSKCFWDGKQMFFPESIYDVKGKNAKTKDMQFVWIQIDNMLFPPEFRVEFYKLMWLKYLDENPDLVEYLRLFDDYNDIFKGKSIICQADCIRQYVQQGRDSLVEDCKPLTDIIGSGY